MEVATIDLSSRVSVDISSNGITTELSEWKGEWYYEMIENRLWFTKRCGNVFIETVKASIIYTQGNILCDCTILKWELADIT